jgi:hypothetical protein
MATTDLDTRVKTLLDLTIAESRVQGAVPTSVEAQAVFQSIAISLMLMPRTALYFAYLAKSGLQKSLSEELTLIEDLKSEIKDLGNPSYKITGESTLNKARTALVQMAELPKITTGASSFSRYDAAINEFLNKHLAKNVKKPGATDLSRTAAEAGSDLVASFQSLKDTHSDFLNRLYTLHVGVDNFRSTPFSAIVGTTTVLRARRDLDEVLALVRAGEQSAARDIAIRLISSRAALRVLGAPPSPFDTLLPSGMVAVTEPATPTVVTGVGPFSFVADPNVTINGVSWQLFTGATALLISDAITFPVTIPANHYLMISVDGVEVPVPMSGSTTSTTFAAPIDLVNYFNAQGLPADRAGVSASEFPDGTVRWMLLSPTATRISLMPTILVADPASTVDIPACYTTSASRMVGFTTSESGISLVAAKDVAAALNNCFPAIHADWTTDGTVSIALLDTSANAQLDISAPALGVSVSGVRGFTDSMRLFLDGKQVAPEDYLQVGDEISHTNSATRHRISKIVDGVVIRDDQVVSFSQPVIGTSALVLFYQALSASIASFLSSWDSTSYAYNLDRIDRALAPLAGSQTPAQRNVALHELEALKDYLKDLDARLTALDSALPAAAGKAEKQAANGILTTLLERRYDAAADFLLRCDLHSVIEMNADAASYGGRLLSSASAFARQDIGVTNAAQNPDAVTSISSGRA